ncbi:hypothetical protein BCA37_07300 [Mycobacterium sp. djl-10]|nr:hypothetical protein BCA37_07300 [Mycobacterium sp. djl-10]
MSRTPGAISPNHQTIPRALAIALCGFMLIAGTLSIPNFGGQTPLPATVLLDIWIVCFMVCCLIWGRTEAWGMFLLVVGYALTRIFPAVITGAPLYDFAQAYRWVLYLMVFTLAVGRVWPSTRWILITSWLLIGMAFVKAVATFLVLGPGQRPTLLIENNFELALFSGMIAVVYRYLGGKERLLIILLLGGLTFMSGSRSGAIAFLILAVFALSQARRVTLAMQYLGALAIVSVGFVTVLIFESRMAATGRIDRLRFFDVFLSETADWGLLQWLFGTMPITPLTTGACFELRYYEKLFSSVGDGSCYSVIFHAFNMRVVFDAGLVGLLLSLAISWYAMRKAGVANAVAVTLLGIAVTNGFSVSGLNNPYVALPVILAITTAGVPATRLGSNPSAKSLTPRRPAHSAK